MQTLGKIYSEAKARLTEGFRQEPLATPALDARLLIGSVVGIAPENVLIERDLEVGAADHSKIHGLIEKRLARIPVARLLGHWDFWGLRLSLNDETLVPRPETEGMIELALEKLDAKNGRAEPYRILDIGTGSGAIAIALLKELPQSIVVATDLSERALHIAVSNAAVHGVLDRFIPVCGNVGDAVSGPFDMIVSNPPYIDFSEKECLMAEVFYHDPHLALFAEDHGLKILRKVIAYCARHLKRDGFGIVEHGSGQQDRVCDAIHTSGFLRVECVLDMAKLPRFCVFSEKTQ